MRIRKYYDWGLEFGYVKENNWNDMLWYAENGLEELPYFIKAFFGFLFKRNMYFKVNPAGKWIYLRGKGQSSPTNEKLLLAQSLCSKEENEGKALHHFYR